MFRALIFIIGMLCLSPGLVRAGTNPSAIAVRGAVPLSVEYASIVRRHSQASLPSSLVAGGILQIEGEVHGLAGRPLVGQTIGLLIGQGNETVTAAAALTDNDGRYQITVTLEPTERGDYWLRLVLLTYGHPLFLTDKIAISIEPGVDLSLPRTTRVKVDLTIPLNISPTFSEPAPDEFHATMNPNTNTVNDVERRDGSSVATPLARGRDSPVSGRSFGDAVRGSAGSSGGRHQQAD